ncbi:MAG: ABC transporter permease subunit [Alphaproteobacteria bacterium]|nr:ABC transporter permease subunit [Alphaproteobacteria bacterium]
MSAVSTSPDWSAVAARARVRNRVTTGFLYVVLVLGSLPIVVPYLWLVTVAVSGRMGATTIVLWRTLAVLMPALVVWSVVRMAVVDLRRQRALEFALGAVTLVVLAAVTGPHLHTDNFRFLWNSNIADTLKGAGGVGKRYPSVWIAFGNSLMLAGIQMLLVVTSSTLAGYYLSRFDFRGRGGYLKGLLILQAFPAMSLIVPIFLIMYWVNLIDSLAGVVLVVAALELPFAIFVMKGFFDAVPWDIEMSAMTDGASRRQAFFLVVLPQVKVGMIAVAVFTFLRGWEEYVFVRTLIFGNSNWTMSLYLFWMQDDMMGTDYAMVSAMGLFYIVPSIVLYTLCQKYLTQMSVGGIKG